ncbi:AB-hydrolase YheT [Metschnikowia bicuspidata var. bicuspidata NRRL YB-4993]|uniref:AB-hydrolase YheT n=1 Tax=Metschnikowia bicuspidata var. bicuspidata NRRL YB-4993 TaxID=869754 RepID=A0A1A0HEU2_9ASCO|nr:AB-hydrolase YheT [Metschnikowia bicuspidata var. bicuspidata NRRL YB-4993]OBA22407.1 AB-hydrolase YheT [Metschnikowia bicuspidata var. bicuspidata NRRL YB-4993]
MTIIGFWKWGFRSSLKVHTSSAEDSPKIAQSTSYADFVRSKLPILDPSKKLWLNPLLFNGSLQTLYYGMHNSETEFQVYYGREIFKYQDQGVCSFDWVIDRPESEKEFRKLYEETIPESSPKLHPRTRFFTPEELEKQVQRNQAADQRPICVVFHGLAGGSHEPLIRNLAQDLKQLPESPWDLVVVNSRGCCRTKITTGKLYSGLSHEDVREALVELKERYPNRPLYTVGFSFGAVLVANYLAFAGEAAQKLVKAAVLIGCPWDMLESAKHVSSSLTGKFMLNPSLTTFLNKLIKSNSKELKEHLPEIFNDSSIKKGKLAKKTHEWDDIFTCKTVGLESSWDYYKEASPLQRVGDIRVPTLSLNATDDPTVSTDIDFDRLVRKNPCLAMVESDLGGHLGWVKPSGEFWCVEVVCQFIDRFNAEAS